MVAVMAFLWLNNMFIHTVFFIIPNPNCSAAGRTIDKWLLHIWNGDQVQLVTGDCRFICSWIPNIHTHSSILYISGNIWSVNKWLALNAEEDILNAKTSKNEKTMQM